jgi:membrane glycosyltransferase
MWRCALFTSLLGFVLGFIVGFVVTIIGRGDLSGTVGSVLGFLVSIPISIIVLKKILNKKFKDFSIVLVPNTEKE